MLRTCGVFSCACSESLGCTLHRCRISTSSGVRSVCFVRPCDLARARQLILCTSTWPWWGGGWAGGRSSGRGSPPLCLLASGFRIMHFRITYCLLGGVARAVMAAQKVQADVLLHRLHYAPPGWDAAAEGLFAQDFASPIISRLRPSAVLLLTSDAKTRRSGSKFFGIVSSYQACCGGRKRTPTLLCRVVA